MDGRAWLMPLSMAVVATGIAGLLFDPTAQIVRAATFIPTLTVVGTAAWGISNRPGPDPFDVRLIDAILLALAFMAMLVLALGSAGMLSWWTLVMNAGMAGSIWAMIDGRSGVRRSHSSLGSWSIPPVAVVLAGLASFGIFQGVMGRIFRPPVGDALAYHLPAAAEWLQRGTLEMPIPAAGDPSPPFYSAQFNGLDLLAPRAVR